MKAFTRSARRLRPVFAVWLGLAAGVAGAQDAGPRLNGLPPLPPWSPSRPAPRDAGALRVQAPSGELPPLPSTSPGNGSTNPNPSETGTPRAENPVSGNEPSPANEEAQAAEPEAEEPEKDETKLLMNALGMEDSPIKIYGWIQNSYTDNTNGKPPSGENFGVFPNHRADSWLGNQYYLIVEKPLEQNDTVNFGFRVDNLFGHDWQFNKMYGLFDEAFNLNRFTGYDLAQVYAEVHLPILTRGGLDVRAGRFYTLAGYEVVPATGRPLLSVPYLFNYGQPFTHVGVMGTLHLTDKINIHNCVINGWDRWINRNYNWGYMGGFSWTFNDDKTTLTVVTVQGPNQFPTNLPVNTTIFPTGIGPGNIRSGRDPNVGVGRNPGYSSNNRSLFTYVLSHKWSDKLTQVVEFDHAFEENIPGLVGDGGPNQNAEWYGGANWFLYQFNDKLTGVWRSEVWRDDDGIRTGVPDTFYEMTLGSIYKPKPWLWFRPEARYDWAQFKNPYNDGTRGSQLTLAIDVILLY